MHSIESSPERWEANAFELKLFKAMSSHFYFFKALQMNGQQMLFFVLKALATPCQQISYVYW
jgi:hypothetical protein